MKRCALTFASELRDNRCGAGGELRRQRGRKANWNSRTNICISIEAPENSLWSQL
jgi:hypothetical protein